MSGQDGGSGSGSGAGDASGAAAVRARRFKSLLQGLDPAAVIPDATAAFPCGLCELKFNDQRSLTKHLKAHERAFDEEELRTGKGAPASAAKAKGPGGGKAKTKSGGGALIDLTAGGSAKKARLSSGGSAAAAGAAAGAGRPKKAQLVRRGPDSEDDGGLSSESEARSEREWVDPSSAMAASSIHAHTTPAKRKHRKKNAIVEEEEDLSEEERRQTALRREQKRINLARAVAGEGPEPEGKKQDGDEGEEDVRCCLCHSADSDETNPIVMCDGPCDLPFHQDCFGIEHIPKGKWFCSTACKAGRRIDRVEHLGAHRIRFQRRRRAMANHHNPREQQMLKEFWDTVEPYFHLRQLTAKGAELLARTHLTADQVSIPALGRRYTDVWRAEDEFLRSSSARAGRMTARNNAEAAATPSPNPSPAGSPVPTSPHPTAASPTGSPTPSGAADDAWEAEETVEIGDADAFASEGIDRLRAHLHRSSVPVIPEDLAAMEATAAKPHSAALTVLAMVGSTAAKPEKKEDEPAPLTYDADAKEPFDRHSYFFPAAHHSAWKPPLAQRRASVERVELSLEAAAEAVFQQATPAQAKFLTGSDKPKSTHNNKPTGKMHTPANTSPAAPDAAPASASGAPAVPPVVPPAAAAASDMPTSASSPVAASSPTVPAAGASPAPSPSKSRLASVAAPILGGKPGAKNAFQVKMEPMDDATQAESAAAAISSAMDMDSSGSPVEPALPVPAARKPSPTHSATTSAASPDDTDSSPLPSNTHTSTPSPIASPSSPPPLPAAPAAAAAAAASASPPLPSASPTPSAAVTLSTLASSFPTPATDSLYEDMPAGTAAPAQRLQSSSSASPTKGGKQPRRGSPDAAEMARALFGGAPSARATSGGKAPYSAGSSSSAAAAAASNAHPATGGKAPRASAGATGGKAPRAKGRSSGAKKDKKRLKLKREEGSDDDDGDASSYGGSSASDSDEMTLSEEEDMRAEQEDMQREADRPRGEHGLGAGKGINQSHGAPATSPPAPVGKHPAGKHPAGKKPRGTGPSTSDRVFSMAPRLNDDVAAEEDEPKQEPLEDSFEKLPTPFFAMRSVDLDSAKHMSIKLPRPRIFKLQHQHIVENFPFVGVINPALLASSCHYSMPPLLYNSATMQLVEMNMNTRASDDAGADDGEERRDSLEAMHAITNSINAMQAQMDIVEVRPQQNIAALLPPPPPTAEELMAAAAREAEQKEVEAARLKLEAMEKAKADNKSLYTSKFATTSLSRRSRGSGKAEEGKAEEGASAAASSPIDPPLAELDTDAALRADAALPLHPTSQLLASLSIEPAYDDEVSAELWVLQRQMLSQSNHNNYVRSYLDARAHASGDWKHSVQQIEQKEQQDKDTLQLYEESFLLSMARAQRESRRAKFEMSEAGQVRNIKRWERMQERNQRHIQRLMKHMLSEVERRDKKREVDERRSASAAQREAKRDRRAALEAQWKSRKDAETYRKVENCLDGVIRQIERALEGKPMGSHKRKEKDPNAPVKPKKEHKKKEADPLELYCICRTPYDNDRFYLGCEVCQNWFHGKCVHVTEEQASLIDDYICAECEKKTGRITTYVDNKLNRQKRRQKLQAGTDEDSSDDDSDSVVDDESSEEELLPTLVIRRTKRGRKVHYQVVQRDTDEEGSDEDEEEETEDEAVPMDTGSSEEEEEEDPVNKVHLRRLRMNVLRLRKLPDAVSPDTKTRHATANLKRYEFLGITAWSSLLVSDDHPQREQTARSVLRRFRREYNLYPSLITSALVRKRGITPSLPLGQRSKHKFSAYTYRDTHFQVARVDKENLVVYVRKVDDPALVMAARAQSAMLAPTPFLVLTCPQCQKQCQGEVGIQRHYARVHPGQPKPDSAALRGAHLGGAAAPASSGAAAAAPAAPRSHKRKQPVAEVDAAAAIHALAGAVSELPAAAADGTPRSSKRARASPSSSPPPPLSLVAAAADATEDAEARSGTETPRSRRATPTPRRDADAMSDVAEPMGSGSSTRSRRGLEPPTGRFTIRQRSDGAGAEVKETHRVVPFKLSAVKQAAAEARRSPLPPESPVSSPRSVASANKFKLPVAGASSRRGAASPLAGSSAGTPVAPSPRSSPRAPSPSSARAASPSPSPSPSPPPRSLRRVSELPPTSDDGKGASAPAAARSPSPSSSPSKSQAGAGSKRKRPAPQSVAEEEAEPALASSEDGHNAKKPRGLPRVPRFGAAPAAAASFAPPSAAAAASPSPSSSSLSPGPVSPPRGPDTLDIVKSRHRQPVVKFAP